MVWSFPNPAFRCFGCVCSISVSVYAHGNNDVFHDSSQFVYQRLKINITQCEDAQHTAYNDCTE